MGRRLLFVPLPFQGHINPMFHLASLLHSRGFAITIFHTHFNSPDPDNYPKSYRFIPVPDNLSDTVRSTKDGVAHIHALNKSCQASFRDILGELLSSEEESVACVIFDAHWYALQAVAKKLGVATMVLRTGNATSFNLFMAFPLLLEKGYLPIQESQLDAFVSELPPLRVKDLPRLMITTSLESYAELLARGVEQVRTSSGLILNTFDSIESSELDQIKRDLSIPIYPIGPLHKLSTQAQTQSSLLAPDQSCMAWLDSQAPKSVIYVSFGSLAFMDPNELVEIAWGLANSGLPFLWVVRPNLVHGSDRIELPKWFEEETHGRGRVVPWAPQPEVLSHPAVGGFWTHCGWNSTLEAICEGVPMLCRPFFGDQTGNARYVSHVWKVGIVLEGKVERGRIERAIKTLIVEREGDEMRERMADLKAKAAQCIMAGGSSYLAVDNLADSILALQT
ncbi:UDP-glycosyltransferase 76B1-like [Typha angustifolia]|uniref:UDP-glycosyltransferase 76B1-like n=1 Tax=Typha angustifolia TaxID=59011 RepID=UPI003C2F159F